MALRFKVGNKTTLPFKVGNKTALPFKVDGRRTPVVKYSHSDCKMGLGAAGRENIAKGVTGMEEPQVSVIMPVYNGEQYIRQAVESVYCQDVPLELIVIDDGSTDGTREALAPWICRQDFHYVKNEKNLGAAGSRNRGTSMAKGKYVAFLDADDWWTPGKLAAQLNALKETGDVLCSTGRELMNPDGSSTGKYIPVKPRLAYRDLLSHNSINCSSVLLLRSAALEFPMEHDRDSHEDYITWLKILKKYGHATAIDEPYLKYRLSREGKSRNKVKSALMTYRAYRYVGYGPARSACFFLSYAIHGLWKYR